MDVRFGCCSESSELQMGNSAETAGDSMQDSSGHKKKRKRESKKLDSKLDSSESFLGLLSSERPVAVGKVSIAKKSLHSIEIPAEKLSAISSSSSKPSASTALSKKKSKTPSSGSEEEKMEVVEDIWANIDKGMVDVGYAIIGYTCTGRPILEHDVLVTLLISYGYKIDHVLAFIDDFNAMSQEDDSFPIIMMNANVHNIYESVEPLSDSIYKKFGENQ